MQNNKPIWLKEERPVSLFVATPVHSDVSMHYAQTMLELQKECMKRSMRIMFQMMKSSLVTQGRNLCVSYFLNTDFTHLLFVDSDIAFDPEAIFRLIELDKDVISIPYPMKTAQWDTLMQKIKSGFIKKDDDCQHHIHQYPLLIKDNNQDIKINKGVIEATHCPTGCMLIKRDVFDKLIKAYPNREIVQKTTIDGKYMDRPLHFFGMVGFLSILFGLIAEIYVLYCKYVLLHSFQQHIAMIIFGSLLIITGVQLFTFGLIGEIIVNKNHKTKNFIKEVIE